MRAIHSRFSSLIVLVLAGASACNLPSSEGPRATDAEPGGAPRSPAERLLVVAPDAAAARVRTQANALGLAVRGSVVLEISGAVEALARLDVSGGQTLMAARADALLERVDEQSEPDERALFLARKDFGLLEWAALYPDADGRGVRAGVIDDGVAPLHEGLRVTTTGARKLLRKGGHSTSLDVTLTEAQPDALPAVFSSYRSAFERAYVGTFDEETQGRNDARAASLSIDLDDNGRADRYDLAAFVASGTTTVCIDFDRNASLGDGECFGTFEQSGNFGYWNNGALLTATAEFDPATRVLALTAGEKRDGHGEGVASVLAGHNIAGRYDGVAPGAQVLDYDISAPTAKTEEKRYTIGKFLRALEWMGEHGAEVINISYSFFYLSPETQAFMRAALDALVLKYNYVLCFSAGNDGPALGSFNRGLIYPRDSLAVGAFAGPELEEYVHGTTGLPPEGRVIRYSSRGPGPDGGTSPSIIAPLASLVHGAPPAGIQAFSGTSSASPAAAGLAAVVLSAVKQAGLAVSAPALVHALRRSAKALPGVPYIDQGAGMPDAGRAFALYQEIIAGRDLMRLDATIDGVEGAGLQPAGPTGLLRFASRARAPFEVTVRARGVYAPSVSAASVFGRGREVVIEYPCTWVTGPRRAFVSSTTSYQSLVVSPDLRAIPQAANGGEASCDVRYRDADTGQLLHVIPVTLVNDAEIGIAPVTLDDVTLGADEGRRFHLRVPPGLPGMRVRAEVVTGATSAVELGVYDPNGNLTFGTRPLDNPMFVAFPEAGHYQLTLVRKRGTSLPVTVRVKLEPLDVHVRTSAVGVTLPAGPPAVELENRGATLPVRVELRRALKTELTRFVPAPVGAPMRAEFTLATKGEFSVRVETATQYASSNWRFSCTGSVTRANGDVARTFTMSQYDEQITVSEADVGALVGLECYPFEGGAASAEAGEPIVWKTSLLSRPPYGAVAFGTASLRGHAVSRVTVAPATADAPLVAGEELEVHLMPELASTGAVRVGTVTTY